MKRFLFFLLAMFFFCQTNAQQNYGTKGDGFLLKLFLPDGSTPLFENEDGGYGHATFGGEVLEEMEGEVAWVRTATVYDSLGCDSVINDLTGKFALVRRGTCELALKCLRAQLAGAKAVIIVNHYTGASDDENTILNMGLGATVDIQGLQIPCIFVCRKVGELMTDAIDNGQPMKARFVFRSLDKATAAYHFATPLSQVDTLKHITAHFRNPSADTIFGATVNAKITEPSGNVVTLSVPVAKLLPGQDTLLFFPRYLPPSTLGDFEVIFSNTAFGESKDTASRRFQINEYLWASDNQKIISGGIKLYPGEFVSFHFQSGALYWSGPKEAEVSHIVFGLANSNQVFIPSCPIGNEFGVLVYDADANNDGEVDPNIEEWDAACVVGVGMHIISGDEAPDSLLAIPIVDFSTGIGLLKLKPRHWYYASILYDYGCNVPPHFSVTSREYYFNFPSSPVTVVSSFSPEGFLDYTIIQRLALKGYVPLSVTNKLLTPSKFALSPNPANDLLQLKLDLAAVNKKVSVSLFDVWGRKAVSETKTDFQQGVFEFDVRDLPSGAYLLWLRTEEGHAMQKVMICH